MHGRSVFISPTPLRRVGGGVGATAYLSLTPPLLEREIDRAVNLGLPEFREIPLKEENEVLAKLD